MVAQGSSWDACLAIITTNSLIGMGNRIGEGEGHLCVPGAPKTLQGYYNGCCSTMAPMYTLPKLIFSQQLMQSGIWRAG